MEFISRVNSFVFSTVLYPYTNISYEKFDSLKFCHVGYPNLHMSILDFYICISAFVIEYKEQFREQNGSVN